jgi:hypothetical protein
VAADEVVASGRDTFTRCTEHIRIEASRFLDVLDGLNHTIKIKHDSHLCH